MTEHTIRLKFEKETKNTIRYQEVVEEGKPTVIGTVYVPKWVVGDEQEIEIVVRPVSKGKGK
jgi:hypothetical protein